MFLMFESQERSGFLHMEESDTLVESGGPGMKGPGGLEGLRGHEDQELPQRYGSTGSDITSGSRGLLVFCGT